MGVLITAILAGIIVGPLMAWLFDRLDHVLWNIFYALLGALVLRIILYFIFPHRVGAGFTAAGVVAALLGAVLATYVTKFVPPIKEMGGSTEEDVHYSEEDAEDEAEEEEKEEKSESE